MSDEDRDVDIESDDDSESDSKSSGNQFQSQADKRAHHNALERKRRDHIKDSFSGLRDAIPALQGEKVASRAQILKRAVEYISVMKKKTIAHQNDIADLKRQKDELDREIRLLLKFKGSGETTGDGLIDTSDVGNSRVNSAFDGGSGTETSDSDSSNHRRRNKRLKGGPVSSTSNT
ncbi:hypothetical protein CHUAL_004350 [Chamberlinius hualienensis]